MTSEVLCIRGTVLPMETVFAVRGAIQVSENSRESISAAVRKLVPALLGKNGVEQHSCVSVVFSVTRDLTAENPARALRGIGFAAVPLFCTQEPAYEGDLPRVIRVLVTYRAPEGERPTPVYLDGADQLRPDISS
ncbi:MAG: chorismate mutase [Spirochaetaceae bacterium]|nr:MAG: chorismate mutase [Spirochaetaceae bacterium]